MSSKRRRLNNNEPPAAILQAEFEEAQREEVIDSGVIESQHDIEVGGEILIEEPDVTLESNTSIEDHRLSEAFGFPVSKKVSRGRKRLPLPESSDGSKQRYYDRYKNQDYVKRNDVYKYCQICKKKVYGKLRSLPSEHRLRRSWIVRLNLEDERAGELWLRDAFSDATHCGEICPIHFPVGTETYKNRELLPLDMRPDPEMYTQHDDENYDFESIPLSCVFCGNKQELKDMIPFVRTRSRRYKWINALSGDDTEVKSNLQEQLKNGTSKFLCDYHFNDIDFDINQYGEWRLRKDALPDSQLTENDKKGRRIYMVNHGDTILNRTVDGRRRDDILFSRKDYRFFAQKARQTAFSQYYNEYGTSYQYEVEEVDLDDPVLDSSTALYLNEPPLVEQRAVTNMPGPSIVNEADSGDISEDSDEENDLIAKFGAKSEHQPARYCFVCHRAFSSQRSLKECNPRTWPYDESKHLKWLELMGWSGNTEIKSLWRKRREELVNQDYNFQPIHICQSHLDYANVTERYLDWLQTYCVLCDQDMGDPNILLPFPRDRSDRLLWLHQLTTLPTVNKVQERRWKWLKERLTRVKPTRYRLCVYHFTSDSFVDKPDCVEFNDASLPLPLGLPEYDLTPRGIWGFIKCPLCDEWGSQDILVDIRSPSTLAERCILVEMLVGDKTMIKKGVEQLSIYPCKICKSHLPPEINDPYSIIAERKLVANITIQCIQCNHKNYGTHMIPFPFDQEQRQHWVDALARDHVMRTRLMQRLNVNGRHYLCSGHFHKAAIRFIPQLGIWKKFSFLPLAPTPEEREKILNEADPGYSPLLIADLDNGPHGIVQELNYDLALHLLDEQRTTAEDDMRLEHGNYHRLVVKRKPKIETIDVDTHLAENDADGPSEEPPILEPEVVLDQSPDDDTVDDHIIIQEEHTIVQQLVNQEEEIDTEGHAHVHYGSSSNDNTMVTYYRD